MNRKEKTLLDVQIISIQASSIMRAMETKGEVISKPKMYTGILPYSLELIELERIVPRTFSTINDKKISTAIINVQFDNSYYEYIAKDFYKMKKNKSGYSVVKNDTRRGKKVKSVDQIRNILYNNGFILDGVHYVEYKRSSSKAKEGDHLFIMEKSGDDFNVHDHMMNYARLGIQFPTDKTEIFDLTSAKAYESLTGSSIEYIIDIKPEEILIVNDIKDHEFLANVNVVSQDKDGKLIVIPDSNYPMKNDLFDGESLLDSSLFPKDENGNMKGFQLLRNNFLKSAAFNCEVQKFFKDREITEVQNAFGTKQDATKIKLIITPNSLKIFKFLKYIPIKDKSPENISMKDAYEYWLSKISSTFGVVKSEHISNFGNGNYNQMSYQMLNSLPLDKDDVAKILETDFQYIKDMKTYTSVFREHIRNYKVSCSGSLVENILMYTDKVSDTDLYKDLRYDTVKTYKRTMKQGKISIKGDYGTICSMPWELLLSSIHQHDLDKFKQTLQPLQAKGEIYCPALDSDEEVSIFRSPHICASNVIVGKNKFHKEFTDYFHFTKGILVLTPWEWDIMERGNSLDFDSDSALIVRDKTILKRSKEVQSFATPIHKIISDDIKNHNSADDLAILDEKISVNKIGEICNLAQVLNSYYWNEYYKGDNADKDLLEKIYNQIIILAILSNIEIDKAKHVFKLEMTEILNEIRNIEFNGIRILDTDDMEIKNQFGQDELEEIHYTTDYVMFLEKSLSDENCEDKDSIERELAYTKEYLYKLKKITKITNRPKRPYFMKFVQEGQYVWEKDILCPMNYVVDLIEKTPCRADSNGHNYDFGEYLDKTNIDKSKGIHTTSDKLYDICMEYAGYKKDYEMDWKRNRDNDVDYYSLIEINATEQIKRLKITPETMMLFINKIYSKKEDIKARKMKDGEIKKTYIRRYPELYSNRLAIMGILNQSSGK
jgi:hypothetical protein